MQNLRIRFLTESSLIHMLNRSRWQVPSLPVRIQTWLGFPRQYHCNVMRAQLFTLWTRELIHSSSANIKRHPNLRSSGRPNIKGMDILLEFYEVFEHVVYGAWNNEDSAGPIQRYLLQSCAVTYMYTPNVSVSSDAEYLICKESYSTEAKEAIACRSIRLEPRQHLIGDTCLGT